MTTSASVQLVSVVVTVRLILMNARQTLVSMVPRASTMSIRTSVAAHLASAVFTAISMITTAPTGNFTCYIRDVIISMVTALRRHVVGIARVVVM